MIEQFTDFGKEFTMPDEAIEATPQAKPGDWQVLADLGASYTVRTTPSRWSSLADHPRERDAQRQARKTHWQLARAARGAVLESLRWVVAAEWDGQVYKVDGHTRSLLWKNGALPNPGFVFATVYRCNTREELNALYATFDTQSAAVTMYDRVTGAYREQGLELRSKRLRSGTIVDALSIAQRGIARSTESVGDGEEDWDVYNAVATFAAELRLLDTVDPQPEVFHTGIVSAALLSLALDATAVGFFELLSHGRGSKREGLFDPVEAILWRVARIKKQRSGWIKAQQEQLCATCLAALDLWRAGENASDYWSSGEFAPVSLPDVVKRVRELKLRATEIPR
jgi:hypothetical protein